MKGDAVCADCKTRLTAQHERQQSHVRFSRRTAEGIVEEQLHSPATSAWKCSSGNGAVEELSAMETEVLLASLLFPSLSIEAARGHMFDFDSCETAMHSRLCSSTYTTASDQGTGCVSRVLPFHPHRTSDFCRLSVSLS